MFCVNCNKETDSAVCPICGESTVDKITYVVYWCNDCLVPIIDRPGRNRIDCPHCGKSARYLCSDLRPVFPEERLLFELMLDKPLAFIEDSVWATGNKYYVNGESLTISISKIKHLNPCQIRKGLKQYQCENTYDFFDEYISRFTRINDTHKKTLMQEANVFIREAANGYPEENIVISFSGGKDTTVTADLVVRALSNPYLVHIFGDTTLEFPTTIEYVKRFRESHPLAIFKIARNDEQDFYEVAKEIGPPARMMRWCCSMFKTGPISRAFNNLYGSQEILTFQGVRKNESANRSKYNRIEDGSDALKIQKQNIALPIFYWNDIDVWLYILSEGVDFNKAYRLGYDRVGCWCCPNNSPKAEFLSKIYIPEVAEKWRSFLVNFASTIGKNDAENYVDNGKWKARQGGNGVAAASSVKVNSNRCTTEDNAVIYSITRPFTEELVNLFIPIGKYAPGLGRKILNERVFVDPTTNDPLIAIMPFSKSDYENAVKIRVLRSTDVDTLLRMARYQVIKYNACRQCLKCESLCRSGAISIHSGTYTIDENRCTHCHKCVMDKYIESGCLMNKYLKTKKF